MIYHILYINIINSLPLKLVGNFTGYIMYIADYIFLISKPFQERIMVLSYDKDPSKKVYFHNQKKTHKDSLME